MNIYTYIFFVCLYTKTAGVKTGYHTSNGHISQIPGLSPTTNSLPEERIRGRRVGVLESDSDYVKLAKQGGHKGKAILFPYISMFSSCCMITATNISFFPVFFFSYPCSTGLLWHAESVISKPSSYKPPQWFGFESGDLSEPRFQICVIVFTTFS